MRHNQGTASRPGWSATESSQASGLNLHQLNVLHGVSPSVLVATAGAVAIAVIVVAYFAGKALWRSSARARRRTRAAVVATDGRKPRLFAGIGPQAVVALGGVAVSVYGLWGFGTDFAKLPLELRVGFVSVFDAAELVLFGMLYRSADRDTGWTDELRLMHRTAWTLVSFSAAMNAVHAPNWWSRPVLAAIPALSAWLIELQLRAKLHDPNADEDEGAVAGPLRLLVLLWQRAWAELFAKLGLDPRTTRGKLARSALAQRAAQKAYKLGLVLEPIVALQEKKDGGTALSRGEEKRLQKGLKDVVALRKRAQTAIDRSDMATDSAQALALVRRLVGLTRVDDVALAGKKDPQQIMSLLEELAVVPAANLIESSARAAEAESARQRAEDARLAAETARQRAEDETKAAREEASRAQTAREEAEKIKADALIETANARKAAQDADGARQRAEDARQRAEAGLSEDAKKVADLQSEADEAVAARDKALEELEEIRSATAAAVGEHQSIAEQAEGAQRDLTQLSEAREQAAAQRATAQRELERAASELTRVKESIEALGSDHRQASEAARLAADQQKEIEDRAAAAKSALRELGENEAALRVRISEAAAVLNRLRGEVADSVDPDLSTLGEGPVWKSEAKEAGWRDWLREILAGRAEPTGAELAARHGVDDGTGRNWLLTFRAKRAQMIAAEAVSADARLPRAAAQEPRADHAEPRTNRAPAPEEGEDGPRRTRINGQRQPV
ncbi:hypothetical protein [Kitasatospora sp. HPMI-4]|uniref:hypothetical protein n=1 Tax=Kitasatospora sp. HPMI-4 TaxID=3448443 RepID=UPI003F1955A5